MKRYYEATSRFCVVVEDDYVRIETLDGETLTDFCSDEPWADAEHTIRHHNGGYVRRIRAPKKVRAT